MVRVLATLALTLGLLSLDGATGIGAAALSMAHAQSPADASMPLAELLARPQPRDRSLNEEVWLVDRPIPAGASGAGSDGMGRPRTAIAAGSVNLQVTVFRPPGAGPFPVVVINHGKERGEPHLQERARFPVAAREFVERGYLVVLPMRQGFVGSGGTYDSHGCDLVANALDQAADIRAALARVLATPEADPRSILVIGQSHGGLATLAFGTLNQPGVRALVNMAGGLHNDGCPDWQDDLVHAMQVFGQRATVRSLWFYGDNDSYFPAPLARRMFDAYRDAGGPARLIAFGQWPDGDAHRMFASPAGRAVWLGEVLAMLHAVGMPTAVRYPNLPSGLAGAVPAASGYARIDDLQALPGRDAKLQSDYAEYLRSASPKAFAVSGRGQWGWQAMRTDAIAIALRRCRDFARDDSCSLYAADDVVVWQRPGVNVGRSGRAAAARPAD